MAQNVYDRSDFFEKYTQLPRQVIGLTGAPEWESLRAMLPPLQGKRVLDLGCGFGWVCRWSRENSASSATGIDVSENMLERARGFPDDKAVTYIQADLEALELDSEIYDVAFSSLTLHYLINLETLVRQVWKTLKPGGSFVFSVEHPIYTASSNAKWIKDEEGKEIWPLKGYLREGPRTTNWFTDGVVKQHRTVARYITILIDVGFALEIIDEWGPSMDQIAEIPNWTIERDRPMFLLIKARKPDLLRKQFYE